MVAVVSAVTLSVVRGAVNTMIVCFADSPLRMEENHPELIQEVVTAWSDAFPETISKHSFEPPTAEDISPNPGRSDPLFIVQATKKTE